MNPTDYQIAIHRFQAGTLSQQEATQYRLIGLTVESFARMHGTSLMPCVWEEKDMVIELIHSELLIALGITALALSGRSEGSGNE